MFKYEYFMREWYRKWILDVDMLEYYVKKWLVFWDEFLVWAKYHRLFEITRPKKYLPYKKI